MTTGNRHKPYTEKHSVRRKLMAISLLLLLAIFSSACIHNTVQPRKNSTPHALTSKTGKDVPLHLLLSSLQLTERDLSIAPPKKNHDSFRLHKVDLLLQDPLQITSYSNHLRKRIGESTHSLQKLLQLALNELELESIDKHNQAIPPPYLKDATDNLFPHIDKSARDAILAFISAATSAHLTMNDALSELTPAERAFLRHYFSEMILMDKIVFSEATKPQVAVPPPAPLKRDEHYTLELSFHLASKIDRAKLLSASLTIAAAIETLVNKKGLLGNLPYKNSFQETPGVRGDIIAYEETPYGVIIIGGEGATYYNNITPLLIIDLGGDDEYHNIAHYFSIKQPTRASSSTIIDCAGNDLYSSDSGFTQGSAGFGFSCLVDLAGNDIYLSQDFSQGCGFFGVGILYDRKGNDRYRSDVMGQGAAAFGVGLLCDLEGNDSYFGNLYSQGVGFVGGMGLLIDGKGNDSFFAGEKYPDFREPAKAFDSFSQGFGLGYRNYASGGIGVLWDNHGSDRYKSSYFAQGSSYWRAIGLLLDAAGSDTYRARRYAQGAGTHSTVGALIDSAGNDSYTSWAISQGCGYDYSQGMLLDKGGNDSYSAEWFSQGSSGASGVGMLLDEEGDDTYHCEGFNSQGSGQYSDREQSGSIGLLLDLEGKDSYSKKGNNNTLWRQGRYGGGIDTRKSKWPPIIPWVADVPTSKKGALFPHTKPSITASTDPLPDLEETIASEEQRITVVEKLSERGPSIIPQLLDYLVIEDRQLQLTVTEIMLGMGKDALPPLVTILQDPATDTSVTTFILSVLTEMEDEDTLNTFMTFLEDEDPEMRRMAMHGLSRLKDSLPLEEVLRCSHDSNPAVRKYCARALEGNEHPAALTVLTGLLADDHFTVRFAAFESLKKTGSAVKPYLLAILYDQQTSPPYARDLAARLMEELK